MDWNAHIRRAFNVSNRPDADVIEELAEHARAAFDAACARGYTTDEAAHQVDALIATWVADAPNLRRRFGRAPAPAPPPENPRSPLSGVPQDVTYAVRLLRRQPRFAALVVLTMALGIGATTVLFSATYGVLMKPLPWPGAERLVLLKETRGDHAPRFGSMTNAAYLAWREQPSTIEEIGAWTPQTVTLTGIGDGERIRAAAVTASLFRAIGARPVQGSVFTDQDEESPVVVVSEGLWRQRFGGDAGIVGRSIQLDGQARTVVGILSDAMAYPDRQTRLWIPFHVPPATGNYLSMFEAIAKLRPGVSVAQSEAEAAARGLSAADTGMTTMAIFGGTGAIAVQATPLHDALTADVRRPLIILLSAVGLLLLVGATNVASLQLARAASRRRELAIRASIGASSARLVRQLAIESLLLGLIGAGAGVGLAWLFQQSARSILPGDFPRASDVGVDLPVVLFAVALSIVTSLIFGLLPALRLRRLNLVAALAEDGGAPVGISGRSGVARLRLFIVAGQIAIACVLLVGALLLERSFVALLHADRGFDPARIMSARVVLPSTAYAPQRRSDVLGQIVERLNSMPSVSAAAFTTELPLTPGGSTSAFTMPPRDSASGPVSVQASPRIVSPRYFAALGLRVTAGRPLADSDTATSEPVVVVNETFQRRYVPAGAVGAKVPTALWGQNEAGDATVVGVVEDVRYIGASTTSLAELYFSHRQLKVGVRPTTATLLVRSTDDPHQLAGALRNAVTDADRTLVPEAVMTLEDRLLAGSLARPRLYAVLIVSFALFALLVTGVGLFGVLSYTVSQRTRELGVRAALGATRLDLIRLVLQQGVVVSAAGAAVGLGASLWLAGFLQTLLYGVTPRDLTTYLAVPATLLVVTMIACVVPARRAARLDPVKALRS